MKNKVRVRSTVRKTVKRQALAVLFALFFSGAISAAAQDHTNPYIGPGDRWLGGVSDATAALPQKVKYTLMSATPSTLPPITINANQDLQTALKSAVCGDVFNVDPQAVYDYSKTGLVLPSLACDAQHWITIQTESISQLPNESTRISPAWAGVTSLPGRPAYSHPTVGGKPGVLHVMPKIILGAKPITGGVAVRLIGFEITRNTGGGVVYELISPNFGAHDFILDRVWLHGTSTDETNHGITLKDAYNVTVINSYLSDFHCLSVSGACGDSQAITGGNNEHPTYAIKIVNNFLEASGENILFGGGPSGSVPSDIIIAYNDFFKPLTWNPKSPTYVPVTGSDGKPHPWIVKNHLELKNAQRVLVEGNRIQNNWGGFSQNGYMVLLTPKNQAGANGTNVCPICATTDVTVRYNWGSFAAGWSVASCGASDNGGWPAGCKNYSFHDNIADHLQYANCFMCGFFLKDQGSGYVSTAPPSVVLSNVTSRHETLVSDGWLPPPPGYKFNSNGLLVINGPPPNNPTSTPQVSNIIWGDNIFPTGNTGIMSAGGGPNNCATVTAPASPKKILANCWVGTSSFTTNVVMTATYVHGRVPIPNLWPAGNFYPPSWTVVQFTAQSSGTIAGYTLKSTSPYKGKGSDGTDPGANTNSVSNAISYRNF